MIERNGSEVQRLRADVKKLQMQNWNLAQNNSLMLAVSSLSYICIIHSKLLNYSLLFNNKHSTELMINELNLNFLWLIECGDLNFLWLILQELNLGRDKVSSFLQLHIFFPLELKMFVLVKAFLKKV